jgi:anti-sigma regulatory factor (Ser/Thr protein kinase)
VQDWIAQACLNHGDATQVPAHLVPSRDPAFCTADLALATWVGPANLVSLASFLDQQKNVVGRDVRVIAPRDADLARYISRMGFLRLLDELGIEHDFPSVRADSALNATALVEVSRFSSVPDVEQLIEILSYRDLPDELREVMCDVVSEMALNVPQHAQVNHGFVAAQVVDNGRTLKMSVADGGVGMLATLRSSGASSEREALLLALQGVSESHRESGGRGIRSVANAIEEHGGRAHLLSGAAMVTIRASGRFPWIYRTGFQGTVFDASLPLQ